MRVAYTGEIVRDQFSIWNPDGTSKISGLADFERLTWCDGVPQIVVVTVGEIAGPSGEYAISFTPPISGFWKVEVRSPSTGDVLVSTFDVVKRPYRVRMAAVDDRTDARFSLWLEGEDGSSVTGLDSAVAAVTDVEGTVLVALGTETPTAAGVFNYTTPSGTVPAAGSYFIRMTVTQGLTEWAYNVGFSKVA